MENKEVEFDFKESVYLYEVFLGVSILTLIIMIPTLYYIVVNGFMFYYYTFGLVLIPLVQYMVSKYIHPRLNRKLWDMMCEDDVRREDVFMHGTVLRLQEPKGGYRSTIKSSTRAYHYSAKERGAINTYFSQNI